MTSLMALYVGISAAAGPAEVSLGSLREGLTFHASFDGTGDAEFGRGDRRIYTAANGNPQSLEPGLTDEDILISQRQGRFADALHFFPRNEPIVVFRAAGNVDYRKKDFAGTVSFWLRLDPERDLKPGYCDPLQITDKKWDDAALFVDFTKDERPRHFRFGVFADKKVWNPTGRLWKAVPETDRPFITVKQPPFARDKWTHVVMTFAGFNNAGTDAVARLYLNGQRQGALTGRLQVFTWDPDKTTIQIGIRYIGLFDDLAIFNRALTDAEVKALHKLPDGAGALHRNQ